MAIKAAFIVFTLLITSGFMFGIKMPLSGEWKKRFSSADAFNQYSESNRVEIKDATLSDIKVAGVRFSDAIFENTDWENVSLPGAHIENSKFIKGKYRKARFQKAVIENTTFEGVTFVSGDFQGATLRDVRFVKCNFGRANFQYLEDSNVVFSGAVLEEVEFYESHVDVQYIDSKLTEIEMMGIQSKDRMVIRGSDVYILDLSKASIPHIEITDSKVDRTTYGGGISKSILMKNLKGTFNTDGAVVDGNVEVENVESKVLFLGSVVAKEVRVRNSVVVESLHGNRMEADLFEIRDSNINDIWNSGTVLKNYKITNTKIQDGSKNTHSKINTFSLENVTLNGVFNFENTFAEKQEIGSVIKGPDFEFIGEGSNIRF